MAEELTPDICVVGGGPGGIAAALAFAADGIPVVLVEKGAMGGSDLASGTLPSKALMVAAELNEFLRRGPAVGVTGAPVQVNLGKVRDHLVAVGEARAPYVSAERLTAMGVRVIAAPARFLDRDTLSAGEFTVRPRRVVLAIGSVPVVPELPGIEGVDTMTVAESFELTRKPAHLLVLGSGSRAFELAQAYKRLGIDATVIDEAPALSDYDPELAAVVVDRLRAEGVRVRTGVKVVAVGRRRGGIRITVADPDGGEAAIDGSHLLVAAGRGPNVGGLDLAVAGVVHDKAGISVDGNLRTSNRRVYAIGDTVAGPASVARAEYQARRVVISIKYRWPFRNDAWGPPAVAFTDPGLAAVGLSEAEARRRDLKIRILRFPFAENPRAAIERMPAGVVKVIATPAGRVLGAAIVGHDAAELIGLWSLAIARRIPVAAMAALDTPWPTRTDMARRIGLAFNQSGAVAGEAPGFAASLRRNVVALLRRLG